MSASRCRSGGRFFRAAAIAVIALALGGCVYLRLLQLKRQLAAFDEHFTLETTSGVRLNCLEPVLLHDDIRWLGFAPVQAAVHAGQTQWHLRWLKQLPPDIQEPGTFEIAFDLFFAGDKLVGLSIPEKYFSMLPKDVVVSGIRSLGGANVNKKQRSVESQVLLATSQGAHSWPTQTTIAHVLGRPTEELAGGENTTWRYHFISADPQREGKDIELRFVFARATQRLVQTHGRLPVGRINLNFREGG